MTSAMDNPLDALNALLEERARYEKWLAQLDARREQTPAHVFDRVRRDYAGRLDGVMVQLRSRGAELEGSAASMEERANALLAEETARRDTRAEVELRAMVGEYTPERAHSELASCDADIARLESDRMEVTAELQRVQEILALVRQPTVPASPPPASTSRRATPESGAFDELAFLQSVVDQPAETAAHAEPPAAGPNGPVAVDRTGMPPSGRHAGAPRTSAPTPNATPAFLKDMPTEQAKTLKCQECGTMNYPTEWYCERCGGELAAM
jgi:hypothetical protein